jgi:hypothetical protein
VSLAANEEKARGTRSSILWLPPASYKSQHFQHQVHPTATPHPVDALLPMDIFAIFSSPKIEDLSDDLPEFVDAGHDCLNTPTSYVIA